MVNYKKLIGNISYLEDLKYVSNNFVNNINSNRTMLITGATGLIGSLLVDSLIYYNRCVEDNKKITLYCTGRNINKLNNRFPYIEKTDLVNLVEQDLCKELDLNDISNLDYIIHAASNSDPKNFSLYPVETINANVIGINNILEFAKEHKSKVVYVSSRESYGFIKDKRNYSEDDYGVVNHNELRSCYPESKRVAELLCRCYSSEYDVDAAIARLGYVYGPSMLQNDSKVIAQFVRNALNKEDIIMKSKGDQLRSYTYVADVADGILKILFKGEAGAAYNVANSNAEVTIAELANKIATQCGKKVIFDTPSEIESKGYSKPQDALLDESLLRTLGYNPVYGIDKGINNTIDIYGSIMED